MSESALVECPVCRAKIAVTAPACPQCGHPAQAGGDSAARWRLCALVLGLLFLGSLVTGGGVATAFIVGQQSQKPESANQAWARTEEEARAKLEARAKPEFFTNVDPPVKPPAEKTFKTVKSVIKPPEPAETVILLVARKNLARFTVLPGKLDEYFVEKSILKDDAPPDALTIKDLAALQGKCLACAVRKHDWVFRSDFLDSPAINDLLSDGKRLFAFRTNIGDLHGGIARLPGEHVNIIWVNQRDKPDKVLMKTLAFDVLVLAADGVDQNGKPGDAMVVVAVSPEQAKTLTAALESGLLIVMPRPPEIPRDGKR
jgi:Flp pilus assembly protein CpaB